MLAAGLDLPVPWHDPAATPPYTSVNQDVCVNLQEQSPRGSTSPGCRLSVHDVLGLLGPGYARKTKGPLFSLLLSIFISSEGTGAPS